MKGLENETGQNLLKDEENNEIHLFHFGAGY
jgi:hypothetical protein